MQIRLNKNYEVINDFSIDKEVFSTKIIDEIPNDIDDYVYKYIDGNLVRVKEIDKTYRPQNEINNDFYEISVDLDFRLACLELGI